MSVIPFLMLACTNLLEAQLDPDTATDSGSDAAFLTVNLSSVETASVSVETIRPDAGDIEINEYGLTGEGPDDVVIEETAGADADFGEIGPLETGDWDFTVEGFTEEGNFDDGEPPLVSDEEDLNISGGDNTLSLDPTPTTGEGELSLTVEWDTDAEIDSDIDSVEVEFDDENSGESFTLDDDPENGDATLADDSVEAGFYEATVTLEDENEGEFVQTAYVHVYPGISTEGSVSFSQATLEEPPPEAENVHVVKDFENEEITVEWDHPDGSTAAGYQVIRDPDNEDEVWFVDHTEDGSQIEDSNVELNNDYEYEVTAFSASGESDPQDIGVEFPSDKTFLITNSDHLDPDDEDSLHDWEHLDDEDALVEIIDGPIDLDSVEFEPLGMAEEEAFQGQFRGNGYAIENLEYTPDDETEEAVGLFSEIEAAKVSEVTIESADISPSAGEEETFISVGLIAGVATDSEIVDVAVDGIVAGWQRVGGIVGVSEDTSIESVTTAPSALTVIGKPYEGLPPPGETPAGKAIGGVAGVLEGDSTISDIEIYPVIEVAEQGDDDAEDVGGIVGLVQADNEPDGGRLETIIVEPTIQTLAGSDSDTENVGGVVGRSNLDSVGRLLNDIEISDGELPASVEAVSVGVLVGRVDNDSEGTLSIEDSSADELDDSEGGTIPQIAGFVQELEYLDTEENAGVGFEVLDSADKGTLVSHADHFGAFGTDGVDANLDSRFVLANNIDGDGIAGIADDDDPFTGELHGSGYTIDGLSLSSTGEDAGLFEAADGAEVHDLVLEDIDLVTERNAGALFTEATDVVVSNVQVSGTIDREDGDGGGFANVGGLAGQLNGDDSSFSGIALDITMETDSGQGGFGGLAGTVDDDDDVALSVSNVDVIELALDITFDPGDDPQPPDAYALGGLIGRIRDSQVGFDLEDAAEVKLSAEPASGNDESEEIDIGGMFGQIDHNSDGETVNLSGLDNKLTVEISNIDDNENIGGLVGNYFGDPDDASFARFTQITVDGTFDGVGGDNVGGAIGRIGGSGGSEDENIDPMEWIGVNIIPEFDVEIDENDPGIGIGEAVEGIEIDDDEPETEIEINGDAVDLDSTDPTPIEQLQKNPEEWEQFLDP